MAGLKLNVARVVTLVGLLIAGVGVSAALAAPGTPNAGGPPPTVPGSPGDDCSHGNSGQDCRPDPNENGKDCDDHGNARGNEDHCDAATTTTTTPTTSTTTSTTTTTKTTTTTPTTSTTPTNTGTTPGTTTTTPGSSAPPASTGSVAGASSAPVTKPAKNPASQIKGARAAHVASAGGELPFTGFPAWALALAGSLMLATGLGLRKVASDS
jgi:hypothetical protein